MSDYKPIASRSSSGGVGLRDKVISIKKTDFTAAPQLNYLTAYQETITAAVVYYNPSNPTISNTAPVNYRINRSITTLSEEPVKFRHNGDTVDMELSVDNYVFLQAQPIVAPYSTNPQLPAISEGDSYERSTMLYIYNQVPVPKASNKIWDGRYLKCVDLEGNDVDPTSRVVKVKQEVKDILENPGAVYSVQPVAGRGTTINPPKKDPYVATYRVKLQEFIATNYNSLGLTRHPKGKADTDIYQEIPAEARGTGKYEFAEGFVAAVLDGDYFVKWANVYRYKETETDPNLTDLYDCCHIIESYEPDGDEVIILGCKCGVEPPEPEEVVIPETVTNAINFITNLFTSPIEVNVEVDTTQALVIPYVSDNSYSTSISLITPDVAYNTTVFINLGSIPEGVNVFVNGLPYNVGQGGLLYVFPINSATQLPLIPATMSVVFNSTSVGINNGGIQPAVVPVTIYYLTTDEPAPPPSRLFTFEVTVDSDSPSEFTYLATITIDDIYIQSALIKILDPIRESSGWPTAQNEQWQAAGGGVDVLCIFTGYDINGNEIVTTLPVVISGGGIRYIVTALTTI